MPPQQRQRLLDLLGDGLHFCAHVCRVRTNKGATYIVAPEAISSLFQ